MSCLSFVRGRGIPGRAHGLLKSACCHLVTGKSPTLGMSHQWACPTASIEIPARKKTLGRDEAFSAAFATDLLLGSGVKNITQDRGTGKTSSLIKDPVVAKTTCLPDRKGMALEPAQRRRLMTEPTGLEMSPSRKVVD